MLVLIDRNIQRNAVTHVSVEKPRTIRLGDRDFTIHVLERQADPPRDDETFRKEQLPYLATVTELARAGRLRLFSGFELKMEEIRQSARNVGYLGLNMLEGIKVTVLRAPIERTIVLSAFDGSFGATEEEQMDFFRSIKDKRFCEMRAVVGDAHMDDAFHLWSAEVANLDGFLTMDRRFLNVMRQQARRIQTPVAVWSPKDLCQLLDEGPTDIEEMETKYPPFR